MKSSAVQIDPSVAVSLIAAGLFVGTFGTSAPTGWNIRVLFEIAWLYLTNARG